MIEVTMSLTSNSAIITIISRNVPTKRLDANLDMLNLNSVNTKKSVKIDSANLDTKEIVQHGNARKLIGKVNPVSSKQ